MATKGTQSNGIVILNSKSAQKGQEEKREARKAKKRQFKPEIHALTKVEFHKNEESLHALFSFVRKTIAGNHITKKPAKIIADSREMKKAVAKNAPSVCLERIAQALEKSGICEESSRVMISEISHYYFG